MKILYVYYRLQLRNACHESGVDFIFLYFIYSFFYVAFNELNYRFEFKD